MVQQGNFTEEEAKGIESNFHKLYEDSVKWVKSKTDQAGIDGYVTLAFGLKLRTPILQANHGKVKPSYTAKKEARTAGNALGQSYCMLTLRAAIDFQERLLKSEHRLSVKLIGTIHDAIYVIMKNDIDVVSWVNNNIVECMEWQDLPEIQHDTVKLSGKFGIFYPDWTNEVTLPVGASHQEIYDVCESY